MCVEGRPHHKVPGGNWGDLRCVWEVECEGWGVCEGWGAWALGWGLGAVRDRGPWKPLRQTPGPKLQKDRAVTGRRSALRLL